GVAALLEDDRALVERAGLGRRRERLRRLGREVAEEPHGAEVVGREGGKRGHRGGLPVAGGTYGGTVFTSPVRRPWGLRDERPASEPRQQPLTHARGGPRSGAGRTCRRRSSPIRGGAGAS